MYNPRLDQDTLLWLLDRLYNNDREWPKDTIDMMTEANEEIFRGSRLFDIDTVDPDKFIKANPSTKEITNPITFLHGNRPTEDGLLSETIFGITQQERAGIYGYIDLHGTFIHPFYYALWLAISPKHLRACVYETATFSLDENGYLKPDPNGETGLQFLIKNAKKLGFANTKRLIPLKCLIDARDRNKLFVTKQLVIPPFYRDVDTRSNGRLGIGEINKLYVTLINTVRALTETTMFGIDMVGATRGRIQDILYNIYNWFCSGEVEKGAPSSGSGIFYKFGILRRTNMGKTTDYAARLVLSAPPINVDSREDLLVNTTHCLAPLPAVMTCAYPFMIFHLNNFFNNVFSGSTLFAFNKKDNSTGIIKLKNPQIEFSNDRFDKEMNEFIHGGTNRFKLVKATTEDNKEITFKFKGFHVTEEEYLRGKRTGLEIERELTWLDVFFICANQAIENKHALISRYPIDSYFNATFFKMNIASTKKTTPMIVNDTFYKWYPDFKASDIGTQTSDKFIDTISISNPFCSLMGADYDGDQVQMKILFSDEANAEAADYINTKSQYITLDGSNGRNPANEALQAFYNLSLILPEDVDKLTKNIEFN